VCFACGEAFELSVTGQCISAVTIPMCTLYGPTQQCFVCQPTYSLGNGNCLKNGSPCLATDPSDDTTCVDCGFGTFLQSGKCIGSINCATSSPLCSKCADGFTLDNSACRDSTGNCKTVGNNGVCVTCNDGFTLNGYRCVDKKVTVFGCYIWNKDKTCLVCKGGYNTYQGYCLLPTEIQQIIMGAAKLTDIVSRRQQTITTTVTTTTTQSASSSSSGASSSGSSSSLATDNSGFSSFGSGFGSFGFGDTGFGGFGGTTTTTTATTSTNTGSSTNSGSTSSGGFGSFGGFGDSSSTTTTTNSNTNAASTANTNSLSTNSGSSNTGFGFSNFGGSTTTTTTVKIDHCTVLTNDKTACLTCEYGYFAKDNLCKEVSPLCLANNVITGACLSCKFNLQLSNGTCVDQFCLSSQGTKCLKCANYFAVTSDGVCQFSDSNCKTLLPARCQDCRTGYFVTIDGYCRMLPPYCEAANIQTFSCLQCQQGYAITNG
jgi:hypothetical protein